MLDRTLHLLLAIWLVIWLGLIIYDILAWSELEKNLEAYK